jgi:pyridoxal phosphate enzyme (YggS family)
MSVSFEKLAEIHERIANAAQRSGRSAQDVRLVAVSKRKSIEDIQALADLGETDFGENQVQEGLEKIAHFEGLGLEWHFIGHLQSNKSRFIPGYFSWVHSIDSVKLAQRIASSALESGHTVNLLLQVNVANDPAKFGIRRDELFPMIEEILERCPQGIALRGLMTLGFRGASEQQARVTFAGLRQQLEQVRQRFGEAFTELSMGMSGDYEQAIEEGATMVRLGTAVFGERN